LNSIIKYIIPLILFILILEGCEKLPKYDETPQIEFGGYDIYRNHYNILTTSYEDSVIFKIKFQDGDGDLGLDENDKKTDSLPNFVMRMYVKNNTPFFEKDTIVGQFQPLTLSAKEIKGPIKGELRYTASFIYPDYNTNDTLKFDIYIKDRANHISNTITTDELVVKMP
jgi:hypothetical protein